MKYADRVEVAFSFRALLGKWLPKRQSLSLRFFLQSFIFGEQHADSMSTPWSTERSCAASTPDYIPPVLSRADGHAKLIP